MLTISAIDKATHEQMIARAEVQLADNAKG